MAALVPRERVDRVWARVAPALAEAIRRGGCGECTLEDARALIDDGAWLLWIAVGLDGRLLAAATTETAEYPRARHLFVTLAGGEDAGEGVAALWPLLRSYAVARECSAVKFMGRRGWARSGALPAGWRHAHDVVVVPVGPEHVANQWSQPGRRSEAEAV